ncbi:proton-dependent oligopeptide transport family protein, partial [Trifolium medium]|nr:proton-dependent oligopeptide transport family protein [Trifolium medium]
MQSCCQGRSDRPIKIGWSRYKEDLTALYLGRVIKIRQPDLPGLHDCMHFLNKALLRPKGSKQDETCSLSEVEEAKVVL